MFKLTVLTSLLASLALVSAQMNSGLPSASAFPSACATQCGDVIEVATLCTDEYTTSLNQTACICNALPSSSSLSTCSSCLTSNNAAGLASALGEANTACSSALDMCAFECGSIPACSETDVACTCSLSFLQGIYNCGACNTANGNSGQTSLDSYRQLAEACVNQNYTSTPTATQPLPSPTGQAGYVAPTLTGTGGGSLAGSGAVSTGLGSVTATVRRSTSLGITTAVTGSLTRSVSVSTPSSRATGTGTGAVSGVPAASSTGAGVKNVVAVGGVLGGLLAVVGLF